MKIVIKVRIVHRLQMGLLIRFSSDRQTDIFSLPSE
jgi:hypothetical protein